MRKPKLLIFKSSPPEKLLSQCPKCRAVAIKRVDGRVVTQQSIAEFNHLEKKDCFGCAKE